ncbi:MAG: mechanosensitive ion channel, partial [Lentisphaeria bacterium]|nr:mechanosensitive ion channel [Lentisphaeria bacterium]
MTKYVLIHRLGQMLRRQSEDGGEERRLRQAMVSRLANVIPAMILITGASLPVLALNETLAIITRNVGSAFIVLSLAMALDTLLDLVDIWYRRRPDAASKPIKGFLQLGKIVLYIVAGILIISMLVNRNPLILLSGLGAMAAVLMLIFQDTILSLVASLQLGSNDMVRIGDWIEMPSQNADGDVIEIALHTVKVQNWDKTITTIPVRKLITDSFKNWRGMFETGGRRIMRSLYLDQRSVRFLNDDEVKRLEDFVVLNEYLDRKRQELGAWNARLASKGAKPINERRVTNLGT